MRGRAKGRSSWLNRAVGVIATLIAIFKQRGLEGIWLLALLPAAVACFYVLSGIGK